MKFVLESQIPGFREKPKSEQQLIRIMAQKTSTPRYSLLVGLYVAVSIVGTEFLLEDVLAIHSRELHIILILLLMVSFHVLTVGFIINPRIKKIVRTEEELDS